MSKFPLVKDPSLVGTFDALVNSGGGYVWDEVLEYRVWCHPENGSPDIEDGNDYYYTFETCEDALEFSRSTPGAEKPLALVLQEEYIGEPEAGKFIHVKEQRLTEWSIDFLSRPRRNTNTIPNFMSPGAPDNRLDIIRGLTKI